MTELLVKLFIKEKKEINAQARTAYGILASIVGIVCNAALFAVKLVIGLMLGSISVTADAFNNLSDAGSSIISFIGVKMAGKPADQDHPFGHGRIEYIAAFIVAFLVIEVGFTFFKSSIDKIRNPEDLSFQFISVAILILSIGVKFWLAAFNKKLGKRIQSQVMLATAADAMGDVVTTSVTIISILIFYFTGLNIDGFIGLFVSLFIMWSGISIAKDTLEPLIGQAVDPQLHHKITEFVESYEGIAGSHDLIVHNYGPAKSMASIHAEVPNDTSIEVSHETIDKIERDALKVLGIVLVIHMDPIETKNDQVLEVKKMLEDAVSEVDEQLSIHDFRLVNGDMQINLVFDLLIPYEYNEKQEVKAKTEIRKRMSAIDKRYRLVITVDRSFVGKEIEK